MTLDISSKLVIGDEICFITIGINKYMLDAKSFISRGRRLSEMSEEEKQELLDRKVEGEWNYM